MKHWKDVRAEIKSISSEEKAEIKIAAGLIAKVIEQRTKLGLSQRDLAEKSGVKQTAIARLEKCNNIPRIDTFARLTNSLNLEIKLVEKAEKKELVNA